MILTTNKIVCMFVSAKDLFGEEAHSRTSLLTMLLVGGLSFKVRNMRKSLAFYRDLLGFNVWVQGRLGREAPAISKLLGMPPATVRWVILQSEDVDWGMVGLFEVSDPAPSDDRHRSLARANRGEACLVFHTPDVERIHRGARRLGLRILCPPTNVISNLFFRFRDILRHILPK